MDPPDRLYIAAGQGRVWASRPGGPVRSWAGDVFDFEGGPGQFGSVVCFVDRGSLRLAARLIPLLRFGVPVYVARPNAPDARSTIELASASRRCPPSRAVTAGRLIGYNFAVASPAVRRETAGDHPAWPLAYYPGDFAGAVDLLAAVADPFLFAHPGRPGRWSRLHSYLGVNPRNALALLEHRPAAGDRRFARFENLASLAFACRGIRTAGSGSATAAVLGACRRFATALAVFWENRVEAGGPERVPFDPGRIFPDPDDAEAFAQRLER